MDRLLRVLIPEDSEDDALLLLRELQRFGYRPEHRRVEDEESMRAALRDGRWDVIICDYSMPRFSGLDALRVVQESGLDIPFILISGEVGEDVAVRAMRAGAHDYLTKGNLSRLGEAIEREIGQARIREELRNGVEKIRHLNRVLGAIRSVNRLIVEERDPDDLLRRAADLLVEARGYSEIVFIRTDESGRPLSIVVRGESEGVAPNDHPIPDRLPYCLTTATEHAQAAVLDCAFPACKECAFRAHPIGQSRLARRFTHEGRCFGGAVITLPEGVSASAEELSLFDEVVEDLSFCLHAIEVEAHKQETEDRFRTIFEDAPVGIFTTVSNGKVLSVNPAMARMLGFESPEDVMARYRDLGSQLYVDPARRDEFIERLEDEGTVENFEYEARTVDGRRIWLSMSARVAEWREDGTFTIEGFTNEISELRRAERRFHAFMEHSPLIAFLKAPDGRYLWGNRSAQVFAGESLVGRKTGFAVTDDPSEVRDELREQDRRVIEDGEIVQVSEMGIPLTTGQRYLDIFKFPVPGPDGARQLGAVCIDVTERVHGREEIELLQGQVQQSQKLEAVGQLAGGVAHDFNNLLTVMLGQCELANQGLRPGDPLAGKLAQIRAAAERASTLTRQLLAFSRRQTLQPVVLDLNAILRDMLKMLPRLIGEDIEIEFVPANGLGRVRADPGQVEQVLMNLAVNARDAMPEGGRLTIETANVELSDEHVQAHFDVPRGPYVMIAVSDTGCGMDEETRLRVFEPFFTTKEKGKGTGLGLSTVYGIVKQSRGSVSVYSEPGEGTTFKVYLPRTDAEPDVLPDTDKSRAIRGGGERILVVEDEESIRDLLEVMLSDLGYAPVCVANGGEALLAVEEEGLEPDLVITDVVMPGMSGTILAERLRRDRPELRVLFMSGYTDDAIVHHGALDPGVPFLPKPFNSRELATSVRLLLAGN